MWKQCMGWSSPFCVFGVGGWKQSIRRMMVCTTAAAVLWCLPSFPCPSTGSPLSLSAVAGLPAPKVHRPAMRPVAGVRGKRFTPGSPRNMGTGRFRPEPRLFEGTPVEPEPPVFEAEGMPFPEPDGERVRDTLPVRGEYRVPKIFRQPDRRISMREEMLRVSDFDSGKYGALHTGLMKGVTNAEGFLTLSTVWGEELRITGVNAGDVGLRGAVMHLAEAVNRYTGIETRLKYHTFLSDHNIQKLPFLYITTDTAFELTDPERANLGDYLRNGGFAFIENSDLGQVDSPAETSLRRMLRDALGSQARFEPLPMRHPLYHCFFDFTDEPPHGVDIRSIVKGLSSETHYLCPINSSYIMTKTKSAHSLEGIHYNGELVAVYSNKGYGLKWKDTEDNVPQLKMGVNLVVYALTREGGMTRWNMERFLMEDSLPE